MVDFYEKICCSKMLEGLSKETHILIAGTTGSGKSVLLNNLVSYIYVENLGEFCFFDLKRVELIKYKDSYSTSAYITEPEDVNDILDAIITIMEERYEAMSQGNKKDHRGLYIVIDELADMITIKGSLDRLVKIGRLGRACNIHLLCATQDPSRQTLKAQLMQNFTCCVALRCRSAIESRQIIGIAGAEKLPKYGKGYIWNSDGINLISIPFVSDEEIKEFCCLS